MTDNSSNSNTGNVTGGSSTRSSSPYPYANHQRTEDLETFLRGLGYSFRHYAGSMPEIVTPAFTEADWIVLRGLGVRP